MSKQNLPNSVTGGLNYVSEKQKYMQLYEASSRTQTGQVSFTATISGITYNTIDYPSDVTIYNKGEEGMLQLLKNILDDYNLDANDFNGKIDTTMLDTDGTLASNSDSKIPTQKAVKTFANTKLAISAKATQTEAQAGTNDTNYMTALKVAQALTSKIGVNLQMVTGTYNGDATHGRYIELGFAPDLLILCAFGNRMDFVSGSYHWTMGGFLTPTTNVGCAYLSGTGLIVDSYESDSRSEKCNASWGQYSWIAFRKVNV